MPAAAAAAAARLALLALLLGAPRASQAQASNSNAMPIGANIDGIADYSWTLPFVDVVRQSRAWGSAGSPWDGNATTGADGWPSQANFGNVFVTLQSGAPSPTHAYPSTEGTWLLAFTGQAAIQLPAGLMSGATVQGQAYDPATDTTTASLVLPAPTPDTCNCIMFGFLNASTRAGGPGLKDIRLLQPGYTLAQAEDFSAPLLALLARFDVLRFMDWASTNGNLISSWAQRTLPTRYKFGAGDQVPWEIVFKLANTLNIPPWINVPAHANDDYVLQLATLAKQLLSPSLPLYLEWSNEVWNWGFEQSHYALAAANASVYAGDPYHLNASGLVGDGNPGYWHMRYYVAVSKAHADIFRSVFGAGSVGKGARVRPVYAWQCGGGHEVGLAYLLQVYGEPAQTFHSMACAPYATIGDAANSPSLTTEQVLDGWRSYQQNISLAGPWGLGSVNYVAGMACTAAYYGLDFVSYESGPDTVQGLDAGQPLWAKGNASADARIEPIVFDYLQSWHAYGQFMGPQNYYTLGAGPLDDRYGIYSVLQDMQHPDTPKLAAIDRARASAVAVSPLIPALPAALNASFFAGHPTPATPNGFNGWPADVYYLVQAAAPLRVVVTLSAGSDDSSAATMAIGLGGVARNEQNVTCESSGNWASYRNCSASAPFDVPAGVSVFRVSRGRPWLGMVYIE